MPPKAPTYGNVAPASDAAPVPATRQVTSVYNAQPPAPAQRRPAAAAASIYDDAEGVGEDTRTEEQRTRDDAFSANNYDHEPLSAGTYTFDAYVDSVIRWANGVSVKWQVIAPGRYDHNRSFGWDQTPPKHAAFAPGTQALSIWRSTLSGAYKAGGWPEAADPTTGWPGWHHNKDGSLVPPWATFFVAPNPDATGPSIPLMMVVKVKVDPPRNDKTYGPKVISVTPLHVVHKCAPMKAPLPRKLYPRIANLHKWAGEAESIRIAKTGYETDVLTFAGTAREQVVVPAGWLTWKDITA